MKMAELAGSMSSVTRVNVYQNTMVPYVNLVSIISELQREQELTVIPPSCERIFIFDMQYNVPATK